MAGGESHSGKGHRDVPISCPLFDTLARIGSQCLDADINSNNHGRVPDTTGYDYPGPVIILAELCQQVADQCATQRITAINDQYSSFPFFFYRIPDQQV